MTEVKTTIRGVPDPRTPGRTAYEISGPNEISVQYAISQLLEGEAVEVGEFTNPRKVNERIWIALGYTIERAKQEVA